MKKFIATFVFSIVFFSSDAQTKFSVLETIEDLSFWAKNVIPISSDSNCSSFLIKVENEVKAHYHTKHTENIYVVSGSAIMHLGDSIIKIKKGDLVTIPPNTVHSVKLNSLNFLEVISIQSPEYKGEDKFFIDQ